MLGSEAAEIIELLVRGLHPRRRQGEELAPVRARVEGFEHFLDLRQQFTHGLPLLLPREMDRDAVPLICGAHPQLVRRDHPDLRDIQVRANLVAEGFLYRQNGLDGFGAWDEVLGLELVADARGSARAEMRQPVVPRPRDAHLLGDILGRHKSDGMKILRRELPAEKLLWAVKGFMVFIPIPDLEPHLLDRLVLPSREQAHAVCSRHDRFEVILDARERHVLVHVLTHRECGL